MCKVMLLGITIMIIGAWLTWAGNGTALFVFGFSLFIAGTLVSIVGFFLKPKK